MSVEKNQLIGAWVPGLPHLLKPELNTGYKTLNTAMKNLGEEFQRQGVKRILYYSTQWISVLGQSVQARANPNGIHVDENWYDIANLPFDFKVDTSLASEIVKDLSQAGYQTRAVDYQGFPIDTGTIVAESLINPSKIPTSMFSCCVYSNYAETVKLGEILKTTLTKMDGPSAVVVVSSLSTRYFTTEIDYREDHIRTPEDDAANRKILALMNSGNWKEVATMRDSYCKTTKADMGLKALAFLEGMGLTTANQTLETKAYEAIYGTGAAVMVSKNTNI